MLAAALVWLCRSRRIRPPGIFALYVTGYSAFRIFEEKLRIDPSHYILGQRVNFWVAILLTVAGAVWFVAIQRGSRGQAADRSRAAASDRQRAASAARRAAGRLEAAARQGRRRGRVVGLGAAAWTSRAHAPAAARRAREIRRRRRRAGLGALALAVLAVSRSRRSLGAFRLELGRAARAQGTGAGRSGRSRASRGAGGYASAPADGATGQGPVGAGPAGPGHEAVPILMYHVINPPPAGAPFPGLYVQQGRIRGPDAGAGERGLARGDAR